MREATAPGWARQDRPKGPTLADAKRQEDLVAMSDEELANVRQSCLEMLRLTGKPRFEFRAACARLLLLDRKGAVQPTPDVCDEVQVGPFNLPLALWQEEAIAKFVDVCKVDGVGFVRITTPATDTSPATVRVVASVPRHQVRVLRLETR